MYAHSHTPHRRFLIALIASAWAHAWLVQVATGGNADRLTESISQRDIDVTLQLQPAAPQDIAIVEEEVMPVPPRPRVPRAARATPAASADDRPQGISDPRYYGARELDVYPRLAAPLEVARGRAHDDVVGRVELLLLVSATGAVEDATVLTVEGPPFLELDARRILSAARFVPGERDGRRVKARLVVEVSFGDR